MTCQVIGIATVVGRLMFVSFIETRAYILNVGGMIWLYDLAKS